MRRRVADNVGLGLDDAAGYALPRMIVDQYFADKVSRQRRRIARQLCSAQSSHGSDGQHRSMHRWCGRDGATREKTVERTSAVSLSI